MLYSTNHDRGILLPPWMVSDHVADVTSAGVAMRSAVLLPPWRYSRMQLPHSAYSFRLPSARPLLATPVFNSQAAKTRNRMSDNREQCSNVR
jgi:hypothetical protein